MRKITADVLEGLKATSREDSKIMRKRLDEMLSRIDELIEARCNVKFDAELPDDEKKAQEAEAKDAFLDIAAALGFDKLIIK